MPKRTRDAAVVTEEGGRALVALAALCAAPSASGDYEEVPLEGGGFKRRRVGAKKWKRYCEHGTRKDVCKECGYVPKKCEHGRQRSRCKECGGTSICEHGKIRSTCKSAEGLGYASMAANATTARSAEGRRYASTAADAVGCLLGCPRQGSDIIAGSRVTPNICILF